MATDDEGPLLLCYDGSEDAQEAGLTAEPVPIKAIGPVRRAILETAASRDAAVIVVGSRGLTGARSMLLGSVSGAVAHHADRPTLVIHRPDDD